MHTAARAPPPQVRVCALEGIGGYVGAADLESNAVLSAEASAVPLVSVCLLTADAVVEVHGDGGYPVLLAADMQRMQQRGRNRLRRCNPRAGSCRAARSGQRRVAPPRSAGRLFDAPRRVSGLLFALSGAAPHAAHSPCAVRSASGKLFARAVMSRAPRHRRST